MRRRSRVPYRSPDGIDWRDPNMPVLRPFEFFGGRIGLKPFSPQEEQEYVREHMLATNPVTWRNDPTYAMRSKRGRRRGV